MNNTLLPCPFCGGEAKLFCEDGGHWVICQSCGSKALTHYDSLYPTTARKRAIAAWNRRADGWIPVSERLPEVGKCVIIRQTYHAFIGDHGEYEGVTIGYLHQPTDRRCKPYFYYAAVSDYGDMVRAQSICPGSEFVTHWMPLPAQPKGE